MPGKLLIIDSISTNRIVMKVRLSSAFYDVLQATDRQEALSIIAQTPPDLVLISAQDEGQQVLDLCRTLRNGATTGHLPIVVISNEPNRKFRLAALKAGANDVLLRPLDDILLLARLRSLLRAHETSEEFKLQQKTSQALGLAENQADFQPKSQLLIAAQDVATGVKWQSLLRPLLPYKIISQTMEDALRTSLSAKSPDIFVIAMDTDQPEVSQRLLAEIRARRATRYSSVLMVMSQPDRRMMVDALDLGAHDVMTEGFDPEEMALRISALAQQKALSDRLRANVKQGLQAAITDPLTGLFNRRYAFPHLERLSGQSRDQCRNFAVMLADLDHFKKINDRHGHAFGDAILKETARRLRENLRAVDLLARIGGEEFLIVLPDVTQQHADETAARLCGLMRDTPFGCNAKNVSVTMSVGVTLGGAGTPNKSVETLLEEADRALYGAKKHGRDQVLFSVAVA